jgi:hypothetical protein
MTICVARHGTNLDSNPRSHTYPYTHKKCELSNLTKNNDVMINNIFNHPVKEGRFTKSLSNQLNLL